MAGWRIGWMAGNKDYINSVFKFKSNIDSGMFLPIQHGAIAALDTGLDWYKEQQQIYDKRRTLVLSLLDKLNCHYLKNQSGIFIWAKIPDSVISVEDFVDELIVKKGVFVTPGTIFGDNGKRFIRVSLCRPESEIKLAVERVT